MKRYIEIVCKAAVAGMALTAAAAPAAAARPQPFKITNIHFETNASACDMGIQISFDTDGVTEGSVEGPRDQLVYSFRAVDGLEGTHDITEGFQERVEPPIIDLESALGCEPSSDAIPLNELLAAWPAGTYEFEGRSGAVEFEGTARLTHKVPAGPEITAPSDGDVVPHDQPLLIKWKKVTRPILPSMQLARVLDSTKLPLIGFVTASGATRACSQCEDYLLEPFDEERRQSGTEPTSALLSRSDP